MKKEKYYVISGTLHSITKTCCAYDLECIITEKELYYSLHVRNEKSKMEYKFGTIDEAMDNIHLLTTTFTNSFKTWEQLNFRLA